MRWGMVDRVLESTGATVRSRGAMYKTVAQLVFLYDRESWMMTGDILKVLDGFHHRAAQRITGMASKRGAGGEWEYLLVVEAMEAAGIHPIRVYIRRRQATIVERVTCHPIYDLFTETERMPGTSRLVQWWDQDAVNEPEK